MRLHLVLLVLLVAAAPSAHALEFRLLSWSGEITDLFYSQGGKSVPVTASETTVSPRYSWSGSGQFVLYRERLLEGRAVRDPVFTLEAPKDVAKAILLLSLDPHDPSRNSGQWIDDTPAGIPPEAVTYLNLSSQTVAVQVGAETSFIEAKTSKTLLLDNTRRLLALKIAAQNPGGWQVVSSSSIKTYPGRRTLFILRDGRPQPNGLSDIIDQLRFDDYAELATPAR